MMIIVIVNSLKNHQFVGILSNLLLTDITLIMIQSYFEAIHWIQLSKSFTILYSRQLIIEEF